MLDAKKIREKLIKYVKDYGVKYSYISDKVFIDKDKLSRFKNNRRKLKDYELERLKKFLDQVN